jgi:hypothetical protein
MAVSPITRAAGGLPVGTLLLFGGGIYLFYEYTREQTLKNSHGDKDNTVLPEGELTHTTPIGTTTPGTLETKTQPPAPGVVHISTTLPPQPYPPGEIIGMPPAELVSGLGAGDNPITPRELVLVLYPRIDMWTTGSEAVTVLAHALEEGDVNNLWWKKLMAFYTANEKMFTHGFPYRLQTMRDYAWEGATHKSSRKKVPWMRENIPFYEHALDDVVNYFNNLPQISEFFSVYWTLTTPEDLAPGHMYIGIRGKDTTKQLWEQNIDLGLEIEVGLIGYIKSQAGYEDFNPDAIDRGSEEWDEWREKVASVLGSAEIPAKFIEGGPTAKSLLKFFRLGVVKTDFGSDPRLRTIGASPIMEFTHR